MLLLALMLLMLSTLFSVHPLSQVCAMFEAYRCSIRLITEALFTSMITKNSMQTHHFVKNNFYAVPHNLILIHYSIAHSSLWNTCIGAISFSLCGAQGLAVIAQHCCGTIAQWLVPSTSKCALLHSHWFKYQFKWLWRGGSRINFNKEINTQESAPQMSSILSPGKHGSIVFFFDFFTLRQ